MQRAKTITIAPADMSDNNIAQSQTPGGAGSLTLNGSAVTGGIAVLDMPRRVMLTCAGNNTARTFVVTGTLDGASTITDSITGVNASSVSSRKDFKTVSGITIDGASTGAVKFGTTDGATAGASAPALSSLWCPIGYHVLNSIGLAGIITGTITYGIQHTLDNTNPPTPDTYLTPFDHASMQSKTINFNSSYTTPVRAVRVLVTSYVSGATLNVDIVPGST